METDRIISALIGLVGACGNNPKTKNTDRIVIEALAFPLIYPNADSAAIQKMTETIYAEKNIISPGCAQCTMPCGNTSDYDMNRLYTAEAPQREAKLRILETLSRTAYTLHFLTELSNEQENKINFLYKALAFVGYDVSTNELLALLDKASD